MELITVEKNQDTCVVVRSDEAVIVDAQSALDLLMDAGYQAGTKNIAVAKELVAEDFFILGTGLAGEILQKYVDYGGRIAFYGGYSCYTSKPLRDFIFESNRGKDVFFVETEAQAIDRLTS